MDHSAELAEGGINASFHREAIVHVRLVGKLIQVVADPGELPDELIEGR